MVSVSSSRSNGCAAADLQSAPQRVSSDSRHAKMFLRMRAARPAMTVLIDRGHSIAISGHVGAQERKLSRKRTFFGSENVSHKTHPTGLDTRTRVE